MSEHSDELYSNKSHEQMVDNPSSSRDGCIRAFGEDFIVIDELIYYNQLYEGSGFRPNKDFYALESAFRMHSQVNARQKCELSAKVQRKKRKRIAKLIETADQSFIELCQCVEAVYGRIAQLDTINGIFKERAKTAPTQPDESSRTETNEDDENNLRARTAVTRAELNCSAGPSVFMDVFKGQCEASMGDFHLTPQNCYVDVIPAECTLWSNQNDECLVLNYRNQERFIIPPESSFIVGDVSLSRHLITRGALFDLIVMDPPWLNKSVKRKKTYAMFNEDDLFELRIDQMLSETGLLAIWVTNNETRKRCVEAVLRHYGLVHLAQIHWLKVTLRGEPICEFQPHHKVPFETIFLACRQSVVGIYAARIGKVSLLISTPSAVHSRKPPLTPVFHQLELIDSDCRCLELYGRTLLPHTTTVGFEPLKLQRLDYFVAENQKDDYL